MAKHTMKLFAVTILAGASTASASPATQALGAAPARPAGPKPPPAAASWTEYIDVSVKPRLIGQRPAPGNTGGGKTKGGGMKRDPDDFYDYDAEVPVRAEPEIVQTRSLEADLNAFDASQATPVQRVERPVRVPGLSDAQLAQFEPMDLRKPYVDLRVKHAPEAIVIRPRRLANARPACGNTGGKSDMPDDCTASQIKLAAELDTWEAKQSEKRYAKLNADQGKLFAAATAILTADPSLKMRLLIDGRPACGNTQGKQGPASYCRIGTAQ